MEASPPTKDHTTRSHRPQCCFSSRRTRDLVRFRKCTRVRMQRERETTTTSRRDGLCVTDCRVRARVASLPPRRHHHCRFYRLCPKKQSAASLDRRHTGSVYSTHAGLKRKTFIGAKKRALGEQWSIFQVSR